MSAVVFDGTAVAKERERVLAERVKSLPLTPRIASVVFVEDGPSHLYTRLKQEAAIRVGIEFDRVDHLIQDDIARIQQSIRRLGDRSDIHGILIQKPSKRVWAQETGHDPFLFDNWWHQLTAFLPVAKDVDCLSKQNLDLVYTSQWQIVPATVKGVLLILGRSLDLPLLEKRSGLQGKRITVIGKSEIVGLPLSATLEQMGAVVYRCGSQTEDLAAYTSISDVVVSATGKRGLVTATMIHEGAVIIDVGSPGADVDFESVKEKAAFVTPVPEGVGPMTVVCLLENLVELISQ